MYSYEISFIRKADSAAVLNLDDNFADQMSGDHLQQTEFLPNCSSLWDIMVYDLQNNIPSNDMKLLNISDFSVLNN